MMGNIEMTKLATPEVKRTYVFPFGDRLDVKGVSHIAVRPSGNHRLITEDGSLVIVKGDWLAIEITGGPSHFQL